MAETTLKPCPFCGGSTKLDMIEDDERLTSSIVCLEESCRALVSPRDCTTASLVDAWNRRALSASPPPPSVPVGVTVKQLQWDGRKNNGSVHVAHVVPIEYWAWELTGLGYWSWGGLSGNEVFGGIEGAKAAAQADYESRILSALSAAVPKTEAVADAEGNGWRNGIEAAAQIIDQMMLCRGADDVSEVLHSRENTGNKVGFAYAEAIRGLSPPSPTTVIDIEEEFFHLMTEAAEESNWIPTEYMMNDWVSDVCDFLRNGPATTPTEPALIAEPTAVKDERLPYDLRLRIGKALDHLVCDDSTPEQVDRFISTFTEFGLTVSGALPTAAKPLDLGITKEWFEKAAAKEGDLEIGAGLPTYLPGFIASTADRYYNAVIAQYAASVADIKEETRALREELKYIANHSGGEIAKRARAALNQPSASIAEGEGK